MPTVTALTLSSRRKATRIRIILWRCWRGSEHGIARLRTRDPQLARRVPIQPIAYLDRFRAECRASRYAFHSSGSPPLQHAVDCVVRYIEAFIGWDHSWLLQRLADRRVVEGLAGESEAKTETPRAGIVGVGEGRRRQQQSHADQAGSPQLLSHSPPLSTKPGDGNRLDTDYRLKCDKHEFLTPR
jgi:hypothetical protein